MKRQRDFDNNDEKEVERERKLERVSKIISEMNRRANERERERKEELLSTTTSLSSSSYSHPLSFLRSLSPPSIAPAEEIKEEEDEDEDEKQTEELKGGMGEAKRPPAYKRLFEKPPRLIVDKPEHFPIPARELKVYRENFPDLPDDLLDLIYQSNVSEELGSPREHCYLKLRNENKEYSSSNDPCQEEINHFVKERKKEEFPDSQIPFEDIECSLYCLLNNLPTSYTNYNDEEENRQHEFHLTIHISQFDNLNTKLKVEISNYKGFLTSSVTSAVTAVTAVTTAGSGTTFEKRYLSLEIIIDLILFYGPKSHMIFSIGTDPEYDDIKKFYSGEIENKYWNSLVVGRVIDIYSFTTLGKKKSQ